VAKNVKGKAATPNFCHQPSSSLKLGGVPNYGVVSSGKEPNTPPNRAALLSAGSPKTLQ